MRIVEELNKGWYVQAFDEGKVDFKEVEQLKEGWISAKALLCS